MPTSAPLKTAMFTLRLSPEEKADLELRAASCHLSLSEALRDGARRYLDELRNDDQDAPLRALVDG